jgi:putative ATP-binding cassette transporter
VWAILTTVPTFGRGQAAWERIQELGLSLEQELPQTTAASRLGDRPPTIVFESVSYSYHARNSEQGFTLGPVHLTLRPGELVFVVGGNGSGKSTLVKLLSGLYRPATGRILVDGEPVSDDNIGEYRELFSVVFSDFYLFESLHGFSGDELRERAERYLRKLDLHRKLSIEGNRLSTTALSTGQRRRLALLTAYLENRHVYVLDEWAADQDPHYRAIFYTELLPELRRHGKTIVVITHDDRYFHVADRILKLDFGQVVPFDVTSESRPARPSREARLTSSAT